jgi:hypothetical protein
MGSARAADAPQAVTFDMGSNVKQQNSTVKPGDVVVTLKNLLPQVRTTYTVTIQHITTNVLPPALTFPASLADDPCATAISDAKAILLQALTELDVAKVEATLQAFGTGTGNDPCSSTAGKGLAKAALEEFTKGTSKDLDKQTLGDGEYIVITVNRLADPAKSILVASTTLTVATPVPPSQWLTFYGFNFVNSGDQNFFSKQLGSATPVTYAITQETNRNPWTFAPSVYFIWLPAKNFDSWVARPFAWRDPSSDVFGGLSAGLGFDTSNPIVFAGYGIGWGYNVMATFGVVMHKEKRLSGQYIPGQVVTDNLTPDQLQQDTYRSRFYVGLAFRFGSNPFGSSKSTTPAKATAAKAN